MLGNSLPSGDSIVERKTPPGRRSISQSIVFHGSGQNHGIRCSGSVQQRHRIARGTLVKRVRTRSRRSSSFVFVFAMAVLLCVQTRGVDFKTVEAVLPDGALFLQPALGGVERLLPDLAGADTA